MTCARKTRHRAGATVAAVHDRRIELIATLRREHRAAAGIEQRIVFHLADDGLDSIERCAAAFEDGAARVERAPHRGSVLRFKFGR